MEAGPTLLAVAGPGGRRDALVPRWTALPRCSPAELRAIVDAGDNDSDACDGLAAQVAGAMAAVELRIADGLAALGVGDRLIALGFSRMTDYAREVLGIGERKAQALVQLARGLRTRPLLRAAALAGEVRIRHAQTVLPVAVGEAEARWVERARHETVRALEQAVRAERGGEPEEEWLRMQVRLRPEDRAALDDALEVAGKILPGASRAERLEAMAQEWLGEHALEAGDDGGNGAGGAFRPGNGARQARLEEQLEAETERWSYLSRPRDCPAPEASFDDLSSAEELDAALRGLGDQRDAWDDILGYCAYIVKATGLWRTAGFGSFAQYCRERLGLAPRTVEQRARLERRLWAVPALAAARDAGLSYEKLRLLAHLSPRELEAWVPRARTLTCVELRAALAGREEAQMRAARVLRAGVPVGVARLLQSAFRAVRVVEGKLLDDGSCLVRVARHFAETWRPLVKPARTVSQKVRERDLGCCQVPGCSRRAVHAHHVRPRSQGGGDEPWNLVALCAIHHLRGVHGGYLRVRGRAPGELTWEVGPRHTPVDLRSRCRVEPAVPPVEAQAA